MRVVGVEHGHAAVAPVGDDDAAAGVDGDLARLLELPLPGAARAESVQVDAARVEHDDPVVARVGDDDAAVGGRGDPLGVAEQPVLGPGVPELAGVRGGKGIRRGGCDRRLRVREREEEGAGACREVGRGLVPRRRRGVVNGSRPGRAQGQGRGARCEECEVAQDAHAAVTD